MKNILASVLLLSSLQLFAGELKVMSYNTYNLFDLEHDEGKNDWEYLPKDYPGKKEECLKIEDEFYQKRCLNSDWTREKLDLKLNQLAKMIMNSGTPDILALSEVENINVVRELAKKIDLDMLIITNSPDHRGIDVALAFNSKKGITLIDQKEHAVDGNADLKEKPTRNILEVILEIEGEKFAILVNHWPSQGNPAENRVIAAKVLKKTMQKISRKYKGIKIISMGDFNTLESDYPHPFKTVLFGHNPQVTDKQESTKLKDKILNLFMPNIDLVDLHFAFMNSPDISKNDKKALPLGTFFYVTDMTWNHLDRFFITRNALTEGKVKINLASYKIETPDFSKTNFTYNDPKSYMNGTTISGIPFRSNPDATDEINAGFSDHFPISFKLTY